MFALNIDTEGRVLSATFQEFAAEDMPIVSALPEGDISDYIFENGNFTLSPIERPSEAAPLTQLDRVEAQAFYTAMITDTILEEEHV